MFFFYGFIQNIWSSREAVNGKPGESLKVEEATGMEIEISKPKMTANMETEQKPYRPSIKLVKRVESEPKSERKSKRRSIHPPSYQPIECQKSNHQQEVYEESEMDREKRLRAESNLKFSSEENRVSKISFDDVVVPYKVDFNWLLESAEIISSLTHEIPVYDSFLQGKLVDPCLFTSTLTSSSRIFTVLIVLLSLSVLFSPKYIRILK